MYLIFASHEKKNILVKETSFTINQRLFHDIFFPGSMTAISGVLIMSLPIPIIVGHFGDEMAELVKKEKAMNRREKR